MPTDDKITSSFWHLPREHYFYPVAVLVCDKSNTIARKISSEIGAIMRKYLSVKVYQKVCQKVSTEP